MISWEEEVAGKVIPRSLVGNARKPTMALAAVSPLSSLFAFFNAHHEATLTPLSGNAIHS